MKKSTLGLDAFCPRCGQGARLFDLLPDATRLIASNQKVFGSPATDSALSWID